MAVDRDMVKAFGYLSAGVIALAAGALALVAYGWRNSDIFHLFIPVVVAYSALVAMAALGLAVYAFFRSKAARSG